MNSHIEHNLKCTLRRKHQISVCHTICLLKVSDFTVVLCVIPKLRLYFLLNTVSVNTGFGSGDWDISPCIIYLLIVFNTSTHATITIKMLPFEYKNVIYCKKSFI